MQQVELNIFHVLSVLKKYWKFVGGITGLATITSVVVVLVLPVYYESSVVFYPYSPESSDPRNMLNTDQSYAVFSSEDQSERYMLVGKSNRVRQGLIDTYHLYDKYEIDRSRPDAGYVLSGKMNKNIVFKKGPYGAIVLSVFDKNRDTAALMANDIVAKIELISQEGVREKNRKVYEIYKAQYEEVAAFVAQLQDSLKKTGINNMAASSRLETTLKSYDEIRIRYEQSKSLLNHNMKILFVVEAAQPSYQKARPKRTITVGITFLVAFFVSLTGIGLYDFIKNQKQ